MRPPLFGSKGAGAVRCFRLGLDAIKMHAAEILGQAANFEDTEGVSSGRGDVQGGCGVPGVASLCGGRVGVIQSIWLLSRQKITFRVSFC